MQKQGENIEVKLPRPYPLQAQIMRHKARYKVIVAGRRAGKTTLAALLAVQTLMRKERVIITSASQLQADIFWDLLSKWLAPLINNNLVVRNQVTRRINFEEGMVLVKTGREPDALRGLNAHMLIFDECALLDNRIWDEVGAPMLMDNKGSAIFISTPRMKNWFYELYVKAKHDKTGLWGVWHYTTYDNPYIDPRQIDEMAKHLPSIQFQQEIMAEFLDSGGSVFKNFNECLLENMFMTKMEYMEAFEGQGAPPRFGMGIDWGRSEDYTAIVVGDIQNGRVAYVDRFTRIPYREQLERVAKLASAWDVELVNAERNSMGGPLAEELAQVLGTDGIIVNQFYTTQQSKANIIQWLAKAFEEESIRIPKHEALLRELELFTVKPTALNYTYTALRNEHDDLVMALALWWFLAIKYSVRWVY